MGRRGFAGGATFQIETSEHTLQDTTAVQLSPSASPGSSRASSPERDASPEPAPPGTFKLFTMETNGPTSATACYSASSGGGGAVRLNLPRDDVAT